MKRPLNRIAILLATCALPAVTLAQSAGYGPDITMNGFVELEHLNEADEDTTALGGEVFFNWSPSGSSSYGFGVIGGLEGLTVLEGGADDLYAVWLAGTYSTAGGVLSFGIPTSPIDDYASTDAFNGSILVDTPISVIKNSFVHGINLFGDERPLGIRYDGTSGALTYGVAYHHIDGGDFDDSNALSAAVRYSTGAWTLVGGFEHLFGSGESLTLYRGGVEADFDQFGGHLYIYSGSKDYVPDTIEVAGFYKVTDAFEVGAAAMDIDGAGNALGLNAKYTLANGAYVQGGLIDADYTDTAIDISVGIKF